MGGIREVAKVACGLDVHRSEVVACLITTGARKRPKVEIRRFRIVLAEPPRANNAETVDFSESSVVGRARIMR